MEFNISDLLDGLEDVELDMTPDTGASARRIKELTMKKIHSEKKQYRRGLSTISKIMIAAAVIAALAIPVAAATSLHFTDWLDGLFDPGENYDTDLTLGSASKNWEVSGYVMELKAENATDKGLTLTCTEWGNGEKTGTLTADEGFSLDKWNGSDYTAVKPKTEPAAGQSKTIAPMSTTTWQVSWADSYGALDSGSYRIGKTFTYTDGAGKSQEVELYAKFRVFAEDMAPYVTKCKDALEGLRNQDSYHVTHTRYAEEGGHQIDAGVYQYYTSTYWKNGDDFLEERRYVGMDGKLIVHKGSLFRDGKGYGLTWNGDNVLSGVATMKQIDWLDETNLDMMAMGMEIWDAQVGEVYAEGNTISLLEAVYYEWNDQTDWLKKTYTMDDQGNLISAQEAKIPSPEEYDQEEKVDYTLEVHDTSAAEIAKVIAAQNVDKPSSFSWAEEQAKYPAGSENVKTEGFANTAAQTVSMGNVVSIAQKECTLEWQNTAVVFYDEGAKVWKVELGFSQDHTVCQTVYLSSEGITLLVVSK